MKKIIYGGLQMIDRERVVKNFIELVSVPCPSLDEKAEAELIAK